MKAKFLLIFSLLLTATLSRAQEIRDTLLELQHQFTEESDPTTIWVEIRDGLVFYEGDILLGDASDLLNHSNSRSATISPVTSRSRLWTDNIVPFVLDNNHPEFSAISQAITHVISRTNLTFVKRTTETNYIRFTSGKDGCFSNIGMIGGEQTINMNGNCGLGAGIHEIGHAVGLFHEQTRKDRDNYVTINWDNIIEDKKSNFKKYNERGFNGVDFDDYDYNSVMHYNANTFSLNGQPTISVKVPPAKPNTTLGNNQLSDVDILSINNLYPILPQPNANIELASELVTSPNPLCLDSYYEINVTIKNRIYGPTEGNVQAFLHHRHSGVRLLKIGTPISYDFSAKEEAKDLSFQQDSIDISSGEYLIALWVLDENNNPVELVQEGNYVNGKLIKITSNCNSQNKDIYEFNDDENSAFQLPLSNDNDSLIILTTTGSNIHEISDIDHYKIQLKEDINYYVSIEIFDEENSDAENNFSNDVIASDRHGVSKWSGYKNSLFEEKHILNGGVLNYRIRSHFPRDTGSYLLKVKIQIDPNPMLEVEENIISVGPDDTTTLVIVNSNRNWKVDNEDDWVISFSNENFGYDTITLHFNQNQSLDDRSSLFTIQTTDDTLNTTFTLVQKGIQRILKGEFDNIVVCNEESESIILIESNTDWNASSVDSWIEVLTGEGSGNAFIAIKLAPNLAGESRTGTIQLETVDGEFQNTINVIQPSLQDPNACVDPVYFEIGPDAGQLFFDITSSNAWSIESEVEWINNISLIEGNKDQTISLDYGELEEFEEIRQAHIVVLIENLGNRNIIIRQGRDFTNSINEYDDSNNFNLKLHPNPFTNFISGEVTLEKRFPMSIEIIDVQGKKLIHRNYNGYEGINNFYIETSNIIPGIYFLQVQAGQSIIVKKVVKKP